MEYSLDNINSLRILVEDNVSLWGLSAQTQVTLLNLSENATFRARDGDVDLVIRVQRDGYSSPAEIQSELAWINALISNAVVEIPTPVCGHDGAYIQNLSSPGSPHRRNAVALTFVTGSQPDQTGNLVKWFGILGALTAKMHQFTKHWPRPSGFKRKVWNYDAMVGPQAYWGSWRKGTGLDAQGIVLLETVLDKILERLNRYGKGPDKFGLVHCDLRLANLLVEEDHLRIIDFDDCGFSWYMYDFAASVSFIEHTSIIPELMAAWVDGYRTVVPLSVSDQAEIHTFVMLRRILLTAWLASRPEIPLAIELAPSFVGGTLRLAESFMSHGGLQR
jgi:Ser/Thr protein kinase RdoA (MazF antagonist)